MIVSEAEIKVEPVVISALVGATIGVFLFLLWFSAAFIVFDRWVICLILSVFLFRTGLAATPFIRGKGRILDREIYVQLFDTFRRKRFVKGPKLSSINREV